MIRTYITPTANRNTPYALIIFWFREIRFNSAQSFNVSCRNASLSPELSMTMSAFWHFSSSGIWALILSRASSLDSKSCACNLSTCCSAGLGIETKEVQNEGTCGTWDTRPLNLSWKRFLEWALSDPSCQVGIFRSEKLAFGVKFAPSLHSKKEKPVKQLLVCYCRKTAQLTGLWTQLSTTYQ